MEQRPVALITGASSGIGEAFAACLAERGYDLIVVARRRDRLEALAAKQRALHGGRIDIIEADLANAQTPGAIAAQVADLDLHVDLLVNNAGFGSRGYFQTLDADRERDEVAVNVSALVALTHAFLPGMVERRHGGVINVASTASFQPVPYMAVYGATKAFVRSFSEALHVEMRPHGVTVLALCPGPTATDFFGANVAKVPGPMRTSRDVALTGLRAYDAGAAVVVDGWSNKLILRLQGLLPSAWVRRMAGAIMRPRG